MPKNASRNSSPPPTAGSAPSSASLVPTDVPSNPESRMRLANASNATSSTCTNAVPDLLQRLGLMRGQRQSRAADQQTNDGGTGNQRPGQTLNRRHRTTRR